MREDSKSEAKDFDDSISSTSSAQELLEGEVPKEGSESRELVNFSPLQVFLVESEPERLRSR